jgi:hypothetical protein
LACFNERREKFRYEQEITPAYKSDLETTYHTGKNRGHRGIKEIIKNTGG